VKKDFLVERSGKTFALYAGLLDQAHGEGLKSIATVLLQIPTDDNGRVAICQATVTTEKGTFSGLGDAAPENVARPMVTCLIRMAETRAKARALRDAVNVGVAALEELEDEDEHPAPKNNVTRMQVKQPADVEKVAAAVKNGKTTDEQRAADLRINLQERSIAKHGPKDGPAKLNAWFRERFKTEFAQASLKQLDEAYKLMGGKEANSAVTQ
jgi:hypothetical protein